jgi:DNA modification methylase
MVCTATDPGDFVVDAFCGSGSASIAALIEGRNAIAIDRDPDHLALTRKRLKDFEKAAISDDFNPDKDQY